MSKIPVSLTCSILTLLGASTVGLTMLFDGHVFLFYLGITTGLGGLAGYLGHIEKYAEPMRAKWRWLDKALIPTGCICFIASLILLTASSRQYYNSTNMLLAGIVLAGAGWGGIKIGVSFWDYSTVLKLEQEGEE